MQRIQISDYSCCCSWDTLSDTLQAVRIWLVEPLPLRKTNCSHSAIYLIRLQLQDNHLVRFARLDQCTWELQRLLWAHEPVSTKIGAIDENLTPDAGWYRQERIKSCWIRAVHATWYFESPMIELRQLPFCIRCIVGVRWRLCGGRKLRQRNCVMVPAGHRFAANSHIPNNTLVRLSEVIGVFVASRIIVHPAQALYQHTESIPRLEVYADVVGMLILTVDDTHSNIVDIHQDTISRTITGVQDARRSLCCGVLAQDETVRLSKRLHRHWVVLCHFRGQRVGQRHQWLKSDLRNSHHWHICWGRRYTSFRYVLCDRISHRLVQFGCPATLIDRRLAIVAGGEDRCPILPQRTITESEICTSMNHVEADGCRLIAEHIVNTLDELRYCLRVTLRAIVRVVGTPLIRSISVVLSIEQ